MMEPYRHDVLDRLILKLLRGGSFAPDDFTIAAEECRLSSAAKKIWTAHYENYMEKPRARYDGCSAREMIRREIEAFGARILLCEACCARIWKVGRMKEEAPVCIVA